MSVKQIEKALRASRGLQTEAAKILGCSQSNVSLRIKASPHLQKVLEEIDDRLVDIATNVVWENLKQDNLTAAIFTLKYKGARRGWAEQKNLELSGNQERPIKIERVIVDPNPDASD